jgi:hypothetical protein
MLSQQRSAIAAVVAAAGLAVEGIAVAVGGAVPDDNWGTEGDVVNAAFIVAALGLVVAASALPTLLGLGRWGRYAVVGSQIGFCLMVVESVASQIHGGNTLGPVFFVGLLLALLGSLVVAIDGVKSNELRWAAALPLLGMLVGIAGGNHGGSIVWGAIWLILAVTMTRSDRPATYAVAV